MEMEGQSGEGAGGNLGRERRNGKGRRERKEGAYGEERERVDFALARIHAGAREMKLDS